MNNDTGSSTPSIQLTETLDDIDAEIDAVPDEEVKRRLQDVLAQVLHDRLLELDAAGSAGLPLVLAGTDAEELMEVQARLRAAKRELRSVEAQLVNARETRDEMLGRAAAMHHYLARTRWNLTESDPGDDPYITQILQLGQKILDEARAEARNVQKSADEYAESMMLRLAWRTSLASKGTSGK